MRLAIPLLLFATPALAHHEAVVVSALPSMLAYAAPLCAAAAAAIWRWRKGRR